MFPTTPREKALVAAAKKQARLEVAGELVDELWLQHRQLEGDQAKGMLAAINYLSRWRRLENRFPVGGA